MKKILLIIGILTAANVLIAQEETQVSDRTETSREDVKKRLELTTDQEMQLKELRKKYAAELKAIRTAEEKSRSEKLYETAAIVEKKEEELTTILSQKQLNELKAVQKEVRSKRHHRRRRMLQQRSKN